MQHRQKYTDSIKHFTNFVVHRPALVTFLALIFAFSAALGLSKLEVNTNYRIFFAAENPQLAAFEKMEQVYAKTDNILFAIKPKNGDVFQPEVLTLIQELSAESWKIPYAQRVDSLTNFQHSYSEEDDLIVGDLIEDDPHTLSTQERATLKATALNEPLIVGKLLNKTATATGINVLVNLPREDEKEVPTAAQAARALTAKYQKLYPNIEIHTSGFLFMNNAFLESTLRDMGTLMPAMFLTLIIIMYALVRSLSATFVTTLLIGFSAAAALGFGGWVGFPLTPPSSITPTIVMTLAIADSVHIIVSMLKAMHTGMAKKEAIIEAIRINFQPVFLTSITTMIGFLMLNFSEAPPFWHLGNMTAFGIGVAFILSVTLLPALLMLLPVHTTVKTGEKTPFMEHLAQFIIRFNRPLLLMMVLVVAIFGSMVHRIEINDQFVQYFDESIPFRTDTDFVTKNLTGTYTIEYPIPAKGPEQITDPTYLQHLDNFSTWLRTQPEVDHVFSITDIFKRLNKNMHGDAPEWYKTPAEQTLASQYLLLYEISLPYGLDLTDRINIDKSASRLTVTVTDISTKKVRAFNARAEAWLKENTPAFMHTQATGPTIMFSFISDRNIQAMIKGNITLLILISVIILIALRHIALGLTSLIPNLAPLAVGFGIWAFLIGQINMAAAFAFAVCLGIIVDDTIHFLSKYNRARQEKGLDARGAIVYAFNTVGTALLVTTIVLIGGFSVLSQSSFQINSYMGILVSIVIGAALVLDFLLLPALLIFLEDISKKLKRHH